MVLELFMGASGYGKTYRLYNRIIEEAVMNPDKKYILIVPEQSSLQAQKDIVRMHPKGGVFNIDVLTFGRLSYRVFEELCIELNETIDDTGKMLILRKVLNRVASNLKVIRISKKLGIVSEIKSMISEFKQYGITTEALDMIIQNVKSSDRLKEKLSDMLVIYKAFEEYIEGKFVTAEDKPEELLKVIDKSGFFTDAVVAFDGFTGFTPVQYRIVERILEKSNRVICTVTFPADMDYRTPLMEENLFYMSKTMMTRLGNIADRLGAATEYTRLPVDRDKYRFAKSSELEFLEQELFRYSSNEFPKEPKDIKVCCLPSPKEEVMVAAATILKQVREKGLRFRDIALVTGDVELYRAELMRVFAECDIPFFMDNKRSLISNPVVEYLRAAIGVVVDNYSYEAVFRFLKNKLCSIPDDKVDVLENYVLSLGIRGKNRWNSMFERQYPGKDKELLAINETRNEFINIIGELSETFSEDRQVSEYVLALYEFMERGDCFNYLNELADKLSTELADGDTLSKAAEYRQTYKKIIELFDQLTNLLGDEIMSAEEFLEILDAGFEEIKVGIIPPSVDAVTIGDVERTRLEHIKYMLVLGVNEGILPKLSGNNGVLSENERRTLINNSVELAPSPREKIFIQNFYIYLNFTEPEEGLFLSYHRFNSSGKDCKPSRIIEMLVKMYPRLSILDEGNIGIRDLITNGDNSLHLLAKSLIDRESMVTGVKELMLYMYNTEPYKSKIHNIIDTYIRENMPEAMSEEVAKSLYSEITESSITRIETFAKCAFAHFARYGLELSERKVHEIDNLDLGNVFHKVIELISTKLSSMSRDFTMLTDDERRKMVEETVMDATADFKESIFLESKTNHYLKSRITDILDTTIWALGEQLKAGKFKPELFETGFYDEVMNTVIKGKIDRVDMLREEDKIYVKIIDYKSGSSSISLDEIYNGVKLQLMVYLHSIIKNVGDKYPDKEIIPAGALYNHIDNPLVTLEKGSAYSKEDYERFILEKLIPSGILNFYAVDYFDQWESGKSGVVDAKKNKDGLVVLDDKVVTGDQLKCLTEFSVNKMHSMEADILSGEASTNPYEGACEYCAYSSVCGFKPEKEGYRKLESIKNDEDKWVKFGYKSVKEENEDGVDE